jgi:hypothetical protein
MPSLPLDAYMAVAGQIYFFFFAFAYVSFLYDTYTKVCIFHPISSHFHFNLTLVNYTNSGVVNFISVYIDQKSLLLYVKIKSILSNAAYRTKYWYVRDSL